ncbi:MAG: hypothetical protein H0V66_11330 [Bdellovibrionales bacterium]|nr:hypothetical protein [Bdellovibrionales bacterium]
MLKVSLFFMMLVGSINSFACSIQVDDNYTRNQMMAHGVSFHDLSLSNVSALAVSAYGRSFIDGRGPAGSCPDYMVVTGRVSLNHSPSAVQHCTYSITVTVKSYMGEDLPDGPIEEVTFSDAEAACSYSITGLKVPKKIRIKPKKQIIVRRYP